jgi:MFS family permease
MTATPAAVQRTYLTLTLLTTFSASFIWGVNTLFLLDAGLDNAEAFAANAFFSAGQVLFEVPTGVVADTRGRRFSFLLGAATLAGWALASVLLGLGFTFFSGATEAWLVDALTATGFTGNLESVFGRATSVGGFAMLIGSVAGGVIAQVTNLGVPYLLRAAFLGLTLVVAFRFMHDIGFTPDRSANPAKAVRTVFNGAVDGGLRNPPVRWLMLAAPFTTGVGFYVFYAIQPYLLQLYDDPNAYSVAGLAAALFAGASMFGGLLVPWARRLFRRRTTALLLGLLADIVILVLIGVSASFVFVIAILVVSSILSSIERPLRQSFINGVIPSAQRATVLSFDSLMGSAGGVVIQPALGRAADVYGYGASYVIAAGIEALAVPFVVLARRERASSDPIVVTARAQA